MSHFPCDARALHRHACIVDAFEAWLCAEADTLVDAADLLGGPDWSRRAARIADALASGSGAAALRPDLRALRSLLTLERTDDPFGFEAARFRAVPPDDPRADAARLCAEALEHGLSALDALDALDLRDDAGMAQRPEAA